MSATVIRLSQYAKAPESRPTSYSGSIKTTKAQSASGDNYQGRVEKSLPEITAKSISHKAPLHRAARKRVFENIVASTLSNPNHPYSQYPDLKGMIAAITEELVNSHYLT